MRYKKFFPSGHTVKQGGGAGNTLSIAQEIMAYKTRLPNRWDLLFSVVIAILNGFLRHLTNKPKTKTEK